MSIRVARSTGTAGRYGCLVAMLLGAITLPAGAQQGNIDDRVGAITEMEAAGAGGQTIGQISEAEQYFRRGVELYGRELYMEALGAFNRALALDPGFEEAAIFRQRCEARLNIAATGDDPTVRPTFDVFDPGMLSGVSPAEGAPLTAEELKIRRVAELLHEGERHLEHQKYQEAVEFFSQVLIIAPDNDRAKRGLHASTLGLSQQNLRSVEQQVAEDRARVRINLERKKLLPEGADADGIKEYRYSVPVIEEEMSRVEERSAIEQALDSPVTLSFNGDHIDDIADFISQYLNINIVIDYRAVDPKELPAAVQPQQPGAPGQQFGPGPGQFGQPQPQPEERFQAFGQLGAMGAGPGGQQGQFTGERSNGIVPYISMRDVTLRQALRALLRPMNLDFTVQPGFIWISSPEFIRTETFEELQTRYYELRNAGAETLFKIVVTNLGGRAGGGGGFGGQQGGFGGGGFGGQQGGFGGGGFGGQQGGFGGGGFGGGGFGGQQGGFGGGGFGGQQGGFGGGGFGGQQGGFGGGGFGGGGMGGGGQFTNISQLFGTINDLQVGETPAVIGLSQLSTGLGQQQNGQQQPGVFGQQAGLGAGVGTGMVDDTGLSPILAILRNLMPEVREPQTGMLLSYMEFNPITNQLIVRNTPTNLSELEMHIRNLDVTPSQVSIEAKFVRVDIGDQKGRGFTWGLDLSNRGNRQRQIQDLGTSVTTPDGQPGREVDISGDGNLETIPFYTRPDGTNVFRDTVVESIIGAAVNPLGSTGNQVQAILTNNADGDQLSVTLDYLDSLTESELLSSPRATTMNRKPVVIADITTQAVQTGTNIQQQLASSGFGGGAVGFSSSQPVIESFIQGITLSVTPQISGDQIRLWLNPQVTSIAPEGRAFRSVQTTAQGSTIEQEFTIPDTSTQSIWTNVIVRDGDTVVLGGSMRDQSGRTEERIPYLSDIPVLGFLFRGQTRTVQQSSLLIFVTADIVDPTGARMYDSGSDLLTVF